MTEKQYNRRLFRLAAREEHWRNVLWSAEANGNNIKMNRALRKLASIETKMNNLYRKD